MTTAPLNDEARHKFLCVLADWVIFSLPPGLSEGTLTEVWDREYEYRKATLSDYELSSLVTSPDLEQRHNNCTTCLGE